MAFGFQSIILSSLLNIKFYGCAYACIEITSKDLTKTVLDMHPYTNTDMQLCQTKFPDLI